MCDPHWPNRRNEARLAVQKNKGGCHCRLSARKQQVLHAPRRRRGREEVVTLLLQFLWPQIALVAEVMGLAGLSDRCLDTGGRTEIPAGGLSRAGQPRVSQMSGKVFQRLFPDQGM